MVLKVSNDNEDDGGSDSDDYDKQWEAALNKQDPSKSSSSGKDEGVPKKVDLNQEWDAFYKNQNQKADPANASPASQSTSAAGPDNRKRGFISDWMSRGSATGTTPTMVQPIRLQGEVDDNDNDTQNNDVPDSASTGSGSGSGTDANSADPPRVRAKFEALFAGMPSITEILSGSGTGQDDNDENPRLGRSRLGQPAGDDTWFDVERQKIMDNYNGMLRDTLAQLEKQRQLDPKSVPTNARAMILDVLKQEMDLEIAATKENMSQQDLMSYEKDIRADMESKDISGPLDESVQKLIDDSQAEIAQQQAFSLQVDEFMRYQDEAKQRTKKLDDARVMAPEKGADLDQWALDRLQEMQDSRQDSDGEEMIMDLLEDSVDDLRERMEKEASRGAIQQRTMKEWQMYRSIATRLVNQDTASGLGESERDTTEAREYRILEQLESWKSYVEKEVITREKSGLSRGPKLPFEWQENWKTDAQNEAPTPQDGRSRSEVRKDVNRMALEAMESLLANASDPARREKLQKEVDFLKANLDADVVKDEIVAEDAEDVGPVDMSGMFTKYSSEGSIKKKKPPAGSAEMDQDMNTTPPPPPTTPFFSDDGGAGRARDAPPPNTAFFSDAKARSSRPAPPVTPFFSQAEESDSAEDEEVVRDTVRDTKLGTMEEQKLLAMYRRAGARSAGEQEKIRSEWETFQELERKAREQSGLSNEDGSDLTSSRNFNVADVMLEGGDFDASKILASIGPRPTRKKREPKKVTESDEEPSLKSSVNPEEVLGSQYRAVAAVGGGRGLDDPEDKASFEDYIRKEDELRESLDSLDEEISSEFSQPDPSFDDAAYAEEAIASLGTRPVPKRTPIIDEGEYSDRGGVLASENDSEDEEEDDEDDDIEESDLGQDQVSPQGDELAADMPEWLRQENANDGSPTKRKSFLGSEIDEVFDDDDYERNLRQLAEYERQRARKGGQMGIDINDVLGRKDDYADYKYDDNYVRGTKGSGWGTASFEARKTSLMDYTELDTMEVNALMDHKDSVYSTGVSQYLPRINKPFKEFGAVFRLEGVLVDVTGLQLEAWTKVAKDRGFKVPELEDVRYASVIRPEVAVKEVFFWTDDFIECGKIAIDHRFAFREAFDSWVRAADIQASEPTIESKQEETQGTVAMGAENLGVEKRVTRTSPDNEADMLELLTDAWAETAAILGLRAPTREEILYAATLGPDLAVRKAFNWAVDPVEVDSIALVYKTILESLSGGKDEVSEAPSTVLAEGDADTLPKPGSEGIVDPGQVPRKPQNEAEFLEIQYLAWTSIAESFGFEPPLPDEVLAAVAIGDVEMAVRDGFGWTEDAQLVREVAGAFRGRVAEIIGGEAIEDPTRAATTLAPEERNARAQGSEVPASAAGPTTEELLQMHRNAWTAAAESSGFACPPLDQIQLAVNMDPGESIRRLFRWTQDSQRVTEISSVYERVLKNESAGYILKYNLKPESSQPAELPRQSPTADEIFTIAFEAWVSTAENAGFPPPDVDQVQFALSVGPEEAIVSGFGWASDENDVLELLKSYKEEISVRRDRLYQGIEGFGDSSEPAEDASIPMFRVVPNAVKWIKSLLDVEMQCGIVSYLDRDQVDILLQQAGLAELITPDKRVSASSGYNRDRYQMLGAALRLERRPDHCIVFDSSPYSAVAAHDNDMRSVCLIGPYPRYELLTADTTTSSFDDLTAMNIRRLFGERVYDQPMAEIEVAQPDTRRKTKTLYWAEE